MPKELKNILEDIKKHEGFRSKVYKCTEGYDTIGYGFAIIDLEIDDSLAVETCKKHKYKYVIITPDDIVIPPKDYDSIQNDTVA